MFFRPLVEGDPDILFMANTVVDSDGNLIRRELEGSHLVNYNYLCISLRLEMLCRRDGRNRVARTGS